MSQVDAYNRKLRIATAAGNVNSVSERLSGEGTPTVPTSLGFPANLQTVASFKIQVSMDDTTYFDIYEFGAIVSFPAVVSTVVPVPDIVQQCCIGYPYMRLVANTNPAADISVDVHFAAADDDSPTVLSSSLLASGAGAAVQIVKGINDRTPAHTAPTATNVTSAMLAANANRRAALFINNGAVDVYLNLGAAAVANTGILLQANGGSFAMSDMMGNLDNAVVNGITASGSAVVLVTEWT